jgi:hypothetical protein
MNGQTSLTRNPAEGNAIMGQRTWFKPENTSGLTDADLRVLNCAVRNAFPPDREPRRIELVVFRTVYRPGMSANDLLTAADATAGPD